MPTAKIARRLNLSALDETPRYRMLAPMFLEDETWRDAGTIIEYNGCPNENMEPLNDTAGRRMKAYQAQLDDGAQAVAELNGRPYRGRLKDLGDQVAEAVATRPREPRALPQYRENIPIRPDLAPLAERRARSANLVVSAKTPERQRRDESTPIAIQGTNYNLDAATEAGPR
jgi:hypothetical protein